jgi:transposase InsO family protein
MAVMPYTQNPHLPKLRAQAVNLVRQGGWSIRKVARHVGVHPSTVSRWMKRSSSMRSTAILTRSSRPVTHPNAISPSLVSQIVELRSQRKRCADVIQAQLQREGIKVSISTVYRTLKRQCLIARRSPWKKYHFSGERPKPEKPGILLQTDTIHIYLGEKKRMYIFTLIDVHSRWAYARASRKLTAGLALEFVREAEKQVAFKFQCVQSDHGPEFSSYFTLFVQAHGTRHRHSRIRKPNDNAHIERFNRTIQEEMRIDILKYKTNIPLLNEKIEQYLTYYNQQRLHMGLNFQTPAEVLQRS